MLADMTEDRINSMRGMLVVPWHRFEFLEIHGLGTLGQQ
jgi:hypothetical protein